MSPPPPPPPKMIFCFCFCFVRRFMFFACFRQAHLPAGVPRLVVSCQSSRGTHAPVITAARDICQVRSIIRDVVGCEAAREEEWGKGGGMIAHATITDRYPRPRNSGVGVTICVCYINRSLTPHPYKCLGGTMPRVFSEPFSIRPRDNTVGILNERVRWVGGVRTAV